MILQTFRLRMIIPAILVLFSAPVVVYSILNDLRESRRDVLQTGRETALSLTVQLRDDLEFELLQNNLLEARRRICSSALNFDTMALLLTDERHQVLAAQRRGWQGEAAALITHYDNAIAEQVRLEEGMRIVTQEDPIRICGYAAIILGTPEGEIRPTRLGVLYTEYDLSRLLAKGRNHAFADAGRFGLIFVLLALVLGFVLHLLVTRRVERLVATMNQVGAGNLSARTGGHGYDEIALLSNKFDVMAERLASKAEDLQRSERKYRQLLETLQEGIWVIERDGQTVFVNAHLSGMLGYSADELLEEPIFSFMDEQSAEHFRDELAREGHKEHIERDLEFIRKDGSRIFATLTMGQLVNEAGKRTGAIVGVVDITARKHAEQALCQSEAALRTLLDATPESFVLMDMSGTVLEANQTFGLRAGKDTGTLLGTRIYDMLPPLNAKAFRTLVERVSQTGQCVRFDDIEQDHYLDNLLSPVFDEPGKVTRVALLSIDATTRNRAEEERARAALEIQDLYNHAPCGYHSLDKDGLIVQINDTELSWLGYTREEVAGRMHFTDLLTPDGVATFEQEFPIFKKQGCIQNIELQIVCKSGRLMPVTLNATAVTDASGAFVMSRTVLMDVSQQKHAEDALKRSEARLQLQFDRMPTGCILWSPDARVLSWNPAAERIFGFSAAEAIGRGPFGFIVPKDGSLEMGLAASQAPEGGAGAHSINNNLTKDGRAIVCEWTNTPIQANGAMVGFLSMVQDITEQKQREEERARLIMAIEHAAEIIFIIDLKQTIQYANPSFERVTGHRRDEIVGKPVSILADSHHDDAFYADMWGTLMRGDVWEGRVMTRRKDGTSYRAEVTNSPVRDEAGSIVSVVSVSRDVTREEALESQLRQSQKLEAIGTLAGGIAHDFNNLLAVILGYGEMVRDRLTPESEIRRHMEQVMTAGMQARELVSQILTFSRKAETHPKPLELRLLVKEALKLLRASIPSTIEFVQDLDAASGMVFGDPTQIHQVIMNLCTNAYHAMESEGGTLSIGLRRILVQADLAATHPSLHEGDYVLLSVSDTGKGMDAEVQERIFEPFFTTKGQGKGTGLGLSIVHGIVMNMGGHIGVYSELGKGTTFNLYLPRHAAEPAPEVVQETRIPEGRGKHVLLLDDEPIVLSMAEAMLHSLGYRVTPFSTAPEALEAFQNAPRQFDAVVTDHTMPKMTGIQFVTELLQVRPGMPIVMTSGLNESSSNEVRKSLGIRHFLQKPYTRSAIAVELDLALSEIARR